MRLRFLLVSMLALSVGAGCMFSVRADNAVLVAATRDTDCADVKVTRGAGGAYEARGCGKVDRYVCDRPEGTGCSKPDAVSAVGCRKIVMSSQGAER